MGVSFGCGVPINPQFAGLLRSETLAILEGDFHPSPFTIHAGFFNEHLWYVLLGGITD